MTDIELKVDALVRVALSNNEAERAAAINLLRRMTDCESNSPPEAEKPDISALLLELGIPDAVLGYDYIVRAIEISLADPKAIHSFGKGIYTTIADEFGTTPPRVERAIRHAIETAIDNADIDIFSKYFGNTISANKGKPTNSQFVARLANVLRRRGN